MGEGAQTQHGGAVTLELHGVTDGLVLFVEPVGEFHPAVRQVHCQVHILDFQA